jgi:hypothetical protein
MADQPGQRYNAAFQPHDINPFEVVGILPSSQLTIDDIRRHIRRVVVPHVFERDQSRGASVGVDVPTWAQVNHARDELLAPGALGPLQRRWRRSTRMHWNPRAAPGSAAALCPPPSASRPTPVSRPARRRRAPAPASYPGRQTPPWSGHTQLTPARRVRGRTIHI